MPVPGHRLEGEMVLRCEMSLKTAPKDGGEHDGPHGYVHPVEASQNIKRGAIHPRLERQIKVLVGRLVLPGGLPAP